ncbi:MAG: hypothetical protein U1E65_08935 [Myxococcota bacterium]
MRAKSTSIANTTARVKALEEELRRGVAEGTSDGLVSMTYAGFKTKAEANAAAKAAQELGFDSFVTKDGRAIVVNR